MNKRNKLILGLLFVGVLMAALDISIVGPAIPSINQSLKLNEQNVSWIFSIYILFSLMGISLFARLSDIYGRKIFYIIAVGIFGIGSVIVSFADDINILLLGRAIQGFGASGIFPVASAVVGDIFPPEKRGRALGLIGMVFGIAFLIGPVIAGVMLTFFKWNSLFLLNVPLVGFIIFGSWKLLPGKLDNLQVSIDWKGIVLLGLVLGTFTFGINSIDSKDFVVSFLNFKVFGMLGISIFLFAVFLINEYKAKMPIFKLTLFNSKQVRIVGFLALGTGLYQATFVFIPNLTVKVFDVLPSTASFMLLPTVFIMAITSPVSGRLIDKVGSKMVIVVALFLMFAGMSLLNLVLLTKFVYYTAGILLGMGLAVLAGSSLRYIMLNEVNATERASSQGILTILISVGQLIASALIGSFTSSYHNSVQGYKIVFGILAFLSLLLGLSALRLKSRIQEERDYKIEFRK